KVWELPSKKTDKIPTDKKDAMIEEIKGVVKTVLMEKVNINKIKYKTNEKEQFINAIKWFTFYDEMKIDILRTILDGETQKDYSIIITNTDIELGMKKTVPSDHISKNYLDKDGFLTMFECDQCDRMMKQLFNVLLENAHKLNFCEICINNLENEDIITYIPGVGYHEKK
ncbi:13168_t:CDS:1, partial [Cetraspora pellucida]